MKDKTSVSDDGRRSDHIMRSMRVLAYFALTITIAAYVIWFAIVHGKQLSANPSDWASFGDFFGGVVGPFIGFASIVLLVETLRLQQRGLKEQREQLQQSAEEVRKQNRILSLQSFEQTFFGWLRDYKKQISYLAFNSEAVKPSVSPRTTKKTDLLGAKALVAMARFLMDKPVYDLNSDQKSEGEYTVAQLRHAWKAIQEPRGDTVRAAIRSLYGIIRWIDQHEALSPEEKIHYISIIRAQLTDSELILLFVNGLTDRGRKFVSYINKYALFDNLVIDEYEPIQAVQADVGISPYKVAAFNTDIARKQLDLSGDA